MNPNIALSFQRPRFDPGEGQRNALAMRQAQMQEAAGMMQLQNAVEDRQLKTQQRNALAGVDRAAPDYFDQLAGVYEESGDIDRALQVREFAASQDEAGRARLADEFKVAEKVGPLLADPAQRELGIQLLQQYAPSIHAMTPPERFETAGQAWSNVAIGAKGRAELEQGDRRLKQGAIGKTEPYPENVAAQRRNEAAARGTNVTINSGAKEHDKLDAKYFSELYTGIQGEARASEKLAMDYKLIDRLIGDAYSGAGANQVQSVKKLGRILGLDLGDVSGPEAAAVVSNQLALKLRNPEGGAGMPGAMSDKDREFLIAMVPGLATTKEGRQLMSEVQKRIAKRNQEVAKFARDYRLQNKYLDIGFEQAIADRFSGQDLFADLEGRVPAETEQAGFQEGQVYTDAQGNKAVYQNGQWVEQ